MSQWFRWHLGTCEDGKFRVVARNASVTVSTVISVWAALLEDAAHSSHRGSAQRGSEFWAAVLDLPTAVVELIVNCMEAQGLIETIDGEFVISRWKERQYETDINDATNADRQRRWRERQKGEAHKQEQKGTVTERNGSVTVAKRPDTDTDTDTEREKEGAVRLDALLGDFEVWYALYPLKKARGHALKAYRLARKKTDAETLMAKMKRYIEDLKALKTRDGWAPEFKNPATWLNAECWADEPTSSNGSLPAVDLERMRERHKADAEQIKAGTRKSTWGEQYGRILVKEGLITTEEARRVGYAV